jgi:hypothetical protein
MSARRTDAVNARSWLPLLKRSEGERPDAQLTSVSVATPRLSPLASGAFVCVRSLESSSMSRA